MRHTPFLALSLVLALAACRQPQPPAPPPYPGASLAWAYPKAPQQPLPSAPPGVSTIPGSKLSLTQAQLSDDENPPDWNPQDHPPAPDVVAHGHAGGAIPCAACHLIGGGGFLGAPDLAGLPPAYIIQQVKEFRAGRRLSTEPDRPATGQMIGVAAKVTDTQLAQAAAYYAALPRYPRYRIVETATVPATRPNFYGWMDLVPGAPAQPIAGRIVEVPEDTARMDLQDPRSGVVDYVPPGAVARGRALVKAGVCAACHGAALQGLGDTPPLAGRSPAYLARMLWDIKTGARKGPAVAPMQAPAAALTEAQIPDVVAYLGSLQP